MKIIFFHIYIYHLSMLCGISKVLYYVDDGTRWLHSIGYAVLVPKGKRVLSCECNVKCGSEANTHTLDRKDERTKVYKKMFKKNSKKQFPENPQNMLCK